LLLDVAKAKNLSHGKVSLGSSTCVVFSNAYHVLSHQSIRRFLCWSHCQY